jgi:hypothetical protein
VTNDIRQDGGQIVMKVFGEGQELLIGDVEGNRRILPVVDAVDAHTNPAQQPHKAIIIGDQADLTNLGQALIGGVGEGEEIFEIEVMTEGESRWAKVDLTDMDAVIGHPWVLDKKGGAVWHGAPGEMVFMHREILGLRPGDIATVWHRNGDNLDNRRANLYLAVPTESGHGGNRRKTEGFTSQYKGVYWAKDRSKWRARIRVDGVERRLGDYHDEVQAARAYNRAARRAWGERARLNQIPRRGSKIS